MGRKNFSWVGWSSYSLLTLALLGINPLGYAGTHEPLIGYYKQGYAPTIHGSRVKDVCLASISMYTASYATSWTYINYSPYDVSGYECSYTYKSRFSPFQTAPGILIVNTKYSCDGGGHWVYLRSIDPILYNHPSGCQDTCIAPKIYSNTTASCELPTPPNKRPPKRPKNPPNPCPSTPNPIAMGTGHKWLIEQDITSHHLAMGLDFQRYYSSARYQDLAHIGTAWTHTFSAKIMPDFASNLVKVIRPDGREYVFALSAGSWIADADITDKLTEIKTGATRIGWLYTVDSTGVDETYNAAGQLLQIENRAGLAQTLTYNDLNQLTQVTNSLGQSLYFNYDVANHISQIINPAGASTSYGYDATGNLTSVTYPDGKAKTYHYGADASEAANIASTPSAGVSYESSLTGITDENGTRIASYRYDTEGLADDEESAPDLNLNINHHHLTYNMDVNDVSSATVVTDPQGTQRTYNFTTVLDVVKSTGQSQPAGSGCAASASAISYDSNGNVASRTDFAGHQTTYQYDLTRNLETSRTEGLTATGVATTATRTITTTWHATWHLPLVITEYNGATATGTALKQTTHVYDTKGNLTSVKETDPARTLNRTTTITYTYSTELPSLVLSKVVNGSRTDVADTTTYTYYPHNAACVPSTEPSITNPITGTPPDNLGCRGQLQSITNALGHTSTYDRYNHHGQVEQTTDANGVITTNSYDARQRLTSRSTSSANTGTQTTSLSYDDAGQITQLKMPDNSVLNYFYDAAHRLTDVQDTLGNTVHYTLDSAGNRIAESTTDPQGNLANTITRSFDALNRLKTVTGVE